MVGKAVRCSNISSDVVVNLKVPRVFFAECIFDKRPNVRYLMREEKERFGRLLQSNAKPLAPKQSVRFK